MSKKLKLAAGILKTVIGCALFGLGFNLFLLPNGLNAGGITGLSMIITGLTKMGSIGVLTALINLPLFALAGIKIGKKFFFGSLLGMVLSSVFIDLFALFPAPQTSPVIGAIYGGALCGMGLGMVFSVGYSTGGSDIIVRLLKKKWQNVPIGIISMCFDLLVAALTGIMFGDMSRALHTGIALFISGRVIDAVVYRFDYSKVAIIISKEHQEIAEAIARELDRGATFLQGEGVYHHQETKVILTAIKRQQLAELKALVVGIDPNAFIIVQEAHQVLGDGFSRYTKDSL